MRESDISRMRGEFTLRIWRAGELLEEYRDENMIMSVAKDAMAKLIGGSGGGKVITTIGFGINGAGPTPSDTALTASFAKAITSVSYPASGQVAFNWTLGTSDANGMAITEVGLICSDTTLFARKTRGAINKSADISLDGTWTIIF